MQFERDTLTQVVEARAKAISAPDQASRMAAENQITGGLGRLLAVMENYPQLKSDQNVLKLQEELTTTENQIAFSRQAYNDSVMQLNTRIESFPTNLIANNFGFKQAEYFQGAPEDQAVPKVDLSMGGGAQQTPPPRRAPEVRRGRLRAGWRPRTPISGSLNGATGAKPPFWSSFSSRSSPRSASGWIFALATSRSSKDR